MRLHSISLLFSIIITILLFGCSSNENENEETEAPEDLTSMIQYHNENNQFEEALVALREADESHEHYDELLLATHMNYAIHLTYEAEHIAMTERMPQALRHYRRVLELDPDNEQAQNEIELIEGIYRQLGREIPEGVAE